MEKLTAKDYRNKHKDLTAKLDGLEARIRARLVELMTQHPELVIAHKANLDRTPVLAKEIEVDGLNTIKLKLETIEAIELALSKLSPIQEQELPFN